MDFLQKWHEKASESFEEWFENASSQSGQDSLAENIDYSYFTEKFDQDWEDYAQANDHNTENSEQRQNYFEQVLQEKAKSFYSDHIDSFYSELCEELDFVDDNHIKVYRSINIKTEDYQEFKKKLGQNQFLYEKSGIGHYWAFKKSAADSHWAEFSGLQLKLTGIIPVSLINIEYTVNANLDINIGMDEKEINLHSCEESYIHVVAIDDDEVDYVVKI